MVPGSIEITAKNYRCFSEGTPLKFDFQPGFTAFVGPNNSGKSTVLRMFYELRNWFIQISAPTAATAIHQNPLLGVEDQDEIFRNTNGRPMEVSFRLNGVRGSQMSKLVVSVPRRQSELRISSYVGSAEVGVVRRVAAGFALENKQVVNPDAGWWGEFANDLNRSLYVGPFRNAISEGSGSYYDLNIGTSFIQTWSAWKSGPVKEQSKAIQQVTRQIEQLFGYERLEINADTNKKSLQAVIGGHTYDLRELGAGLAQFIVVLGNVAIRKPSYLLIDEPELNLHPALQPTFLSALASHTEKGVLFATHSIGLAKAMADQVYSFQPGADGAIVRPFSQTTNLPEFLGEMSYSTFRELGYDRILLVEGVTEVRAVRELLSLLGKGRELVVLPLGGSALICSGAEHELGELTQLCDKIAVLIDSEKTSATAQFGGDRQGFVEVCRKLKFAVHVAERRALENYFPERAIQAVKGEKYRALAPYESLSESAMQWGKRENWRICREMTREELLATDVGEFLDSL